MANDTFFVDLETTANGGPSGKSPEAHWRSNKVLLCGWQMHNETIQINDNVYALCAAIRDTIDIGRTPVIVAHNAKFDLKYLMRDVPQHVGGSPNMWRSVKVWDTMTWEYLHSGHITKFAALEQTAQRYGVQFKKTLDLGALIAAGVKMEDIDINDLKTYLFDDVVALRSIWAAQYALNEQFDMNYLLPLCEMELNGLYIDEPQLNTLFMTLQQTVDYEDMLMMKHIVASCEWQNGDPIDIMEDFTEGIGLKSKVIKPHSRRTLSFLLTGEPSVLKITDKWQVSYKSGLEPFHGWDQTLIPSYFQGKTHLGYEIDEHVLELDKSWITACTAGQRKANKILSTYLSPFLEHMKVSGGTVHPKLNTTITATGRLSSSQPNGQNMPGIVRKLVAIKGNLLSNNLSKKIYEIDFTQLEMVAVACISGCADMIHALRRGDDLHYLSGRKVYGWKDESDMTGPARKIVKQVNFGVLYGGKASGLSHQTGVRRDIIQNLIDGFYTAFPGVAIWQKDIFTEVVDQMVALDVKDGVQRYGSLWTLPISGRKFMFQEAEAPGWLRKKTGRPWSFSPTHTSNYPIQGFAGGDIVMYALSWLWRNHNTMRYLLTVHDSIIIETAHTQHFVEQAVEDMCKATAKHFNLPLDLHCVVEGGTHWK